MSDYVLKHIVRSRGDGSVDNILSSPHSTTEIFIGIDGKHNNIGVDYVVAPNYSLKQVIDDMREDLENQGITTGILKVVLLEGDYVIPESPSYTNHLNFIFKGSSLNFSKVILEGIGDVTISGEMNILRCSVDFVMNNIKVKVTQSYGTSSHAYDAEVIPIELWGYFNQFNDVEIKVTAEDVWRTGGAPDGYYAADERLMVHGFTIINLRSEASATSLISDTGTANVLAKQTVFNRCKVFLDYKITDTTITSSQYRCGNFVGSGQLPYGIDEEGHREYYSNTYAPAVVFNECAFDFRISSYMVVGNNNGSQLGIAECANSECQYHSCTFNLEGAIGNGSSVAWACISKEYSHLSIDNCYINLESFGQITHEIGYVANGFRRSLTNSTVVKFQERDTDCLVLSSLTHIHGNMLAVRSGVVSPREIAIQSPAIVTGNQFVKPNSDDQGRVTYRVTHDTTPLIIKNNILVNFSIEPYSGGVSSSNVIVEDNLTGKGIYTVIFNRGNKLEE